ncbi:unnamed protein product [Clonostachys byssicola]|uniref:Branched-chain-amino-acid aminotransferase n=1 Tax=Clonostachys byssicola TaxID=160290 RepID=A0A9N9UD29_9HYPO|nr:unnamed protein product [Clonostachys byssicola]
MTVTKAVSSLDASKLEVLPLDSPKPVPTPDDSSISALKTTTDRMITVSWTAAEGWASPQLVPYGPLSLMPTASALQYATECFEGMKLFRGHDGRLRLFRPLYNCQRMLSSASRISLPQFEPDELLKLIRRLCAMEAPKWLPRDRTGSALYIRPTMVGTDSSLGFKVPEEAQLCIFMLYWPSPSMVTDPTQSVSRRGMRLLTSSEAAVRSWPGGTGLAKIGGNYGPTLFEHNKAKARGYDQVLWLYGPDRRITEAGSTNFFILWRTPAGELELTTPPLDNEGLILAGNTRQTILELFRTSFASSASSPLEPCNVLERRITMSDIECAVGEGLVLGAFAVGTAAWIQEVEEIGHDGREIRINISKAPHVAYIREKLAGIMLGDVENDWVEIVEEAAI